MEPLKPRPDSWEAPRYISDGDTVWLLLERVNELYIRVVRCHVITAQGDHAWLYALPFGPRVWRDLAELRVPPEDARHPRIADTLFDVLFEEDGEKEEEGVA